LISGNVSYLVGQPPVTITPVDSQWRAALPLDRRSVAHPPQPAGRALSYGDYFDAARQFLLRDDMAVATRAAGVPAVRIDHLAIHLAKHGAFYHPARVVVTTGTDRTSLVLNVAVNPAGRAALVQECTALEHLFRPDRPFLPRVFGHGIERVGDFEFPIFAAEWLEGFCEFHLASASGGALQWQVWGDRGERWALSEAHISDLFRQATHILTTYFDPFTFESILGWHHAAGDFIVKTGPDRLAVRLITVRRYAPLFAGDLPRAPTLETVLESLAAFFLDLSLRMRLDRLEGIRELVWAPDTILSAVWKGFADGVQALAIDHGLPAEFSAAVLGYLAAHPTDALEALGRRIAARYPQSSGERRLIELHLKDHVMMLGAIMTPQ
jgi:hypothetical protein